MVVFLVAGFGYGNASRQLAIIQELRKVEKDLPIVVFSWGRGYDFLAPEAERFQFKIYRLLNFCPRIKISFLLSFFFTGLFYLLQYPLNFLYLLGWGIWNRPKLIVFDSEYHIPAFVFTRAWRISVNQVPNIYEQSKAYTWSFIRSRGFLFSYLIEMLDYWFQCLFADEVLVPMLSPPKNPHPALPFHAISLIVREEFLRMPLSSEKESRGPAVILGGSGVDTLALHHWAEQNSARVFERTLGESSKDSLLLQELSQYNPILLQGGLSSISEGLAMKKYLWICPVKKHWEQFINSQEVRSLNLGEVIDLNQFRGKMEAKDRYRSQVLDISCTGSLEAADYLIKKLKVNKLAP